jgi:hypothetical protein
MGSRFSTCRGVLLCLFSFWVSLSAGPLYPQEQENAEPKILKLEIPVAQVLSVRAPAVANKNEDILIRAEIQNYEKVKNAYLLYKKYYDSSYTRIPMVKDPEGALVGRIPKEIVQSVWIDYYIETEDEAGSVVESYGSLLEPKTVKILNVSIQKERNRSVFYVAGGALGLCLVWMLAAAVSRRKEKNRLLDQLFWTRLFTPILGLHGQELQSKLLYLSTFSIRHPVIGEREFSRKYLYTKLTMVRKIRLPELAKKVDSCLGRGFTVEVPRIFEPAEKKKRQKQPQSRDSRGYVM